eukprot:365921-Chlamydomonas_euryale.AAC.3
MSVLLRKQACHHYHGLRPAVVMLRLATDANSGYFSPLRVCVLKGGASAWRLCGVSTPGCVHTRPLLPVAAAGLRAEGGAGGTASARSGAVFPHPDVSTPAHWCLTQMQKGSAESP